MSFQNSSKEANMFFFEHPEDGKLSLQVLKPPTSGTEVLPWTSCLHSSLSPHLVPLAPKLRYGRPCSSAAAMRLRLSLGVNRDKKRTVCVPWLIAASITCQKQLEPNSYYTDTGYEHHQRTPPTAKNLPHPNILICRDVGLWHCDVANLL